MEADRDQGRILILQARPVPGFGNSPEINSIDFLQEIDQKNYHYYDMFASLAELQQAIHPRYCQGEFEQTQEPQQCRIHPRKSIYYEVFASYCVGMKGFDKILMSLQKTFHPRKENYHDMFAKGLRRVEVVNASQQHLPEDPPGSVSREPSPEADMR